MGVDIEYRSDRIRRIASRFLRPDESASSTDDLLTCWCVKEAVYKLRSASHLAYDQMRVHLDTATADDLLAADSLSFGREITADYVLVWTSE